MKKNKHMETTIQPDAAVKPPEAKPEPTHIDGLPVKVEDGGKFFELNEFDGASKGFKFYVMQFKTLEDAIEHYKALKQDDAILTLVNRQLNFNMRTKAKNQITNEDVAKKLLSRGETLLINVDEARQFVPGEREVQVPADDPVDRQAAPADPGPVADAGVRGRARDLLPVPHAARRVLPAARLKHVLTATRAAVSRPTAMWQDIRSPIRTFRLCWKRACTGRTARCATRSITTHRSCRARCLPKV